jgi:hypothetical protein
MEVPTSSLGFSQAAFPGMLARPPLCSIRILVMLLGGSYLAEDPLVHVKGTGFPWEVGHNQMGTCIVATFIQNQLL